MRTSAAYVVKVPEEGPVRAIKDLGGADAAISVAAAPEAFELR